MMLSNIAILKFVDAHVAKILSIPHTSENDFVQSYNMPHLSYALEILTDTQAM